MDNDSLLKIITDIFSSDKVFLQKIYNINSYDEGILYIKNNELNDITELRILNCLYKIHIQDDIFPSKDYINILTDNYFKLYNIKLKKSGLKNIIMNNKYEKKYNYIIRLIEKNINYIIEE